MAQRFPLNALPGDCLALVLSHTSPRDTCRLSCVNKAWHEAAGHEGAWNRHMHWLPSVASHFPALENAPSRRAAFIRLLDGVLSKDGAYCLTVSPSGQLSLEVSVAHKLGAVWMDRDRDNQYWQRRPSVGSSHFASSAYLKWVCWFHVGPSHIHPPFPLPAGMYSVKWKLRRDRSTFHWGSALPTSSLKAGQINANRYVAEWADTEPTVFKSIQVNLRRLPQNPSEALRRARAVVAVMETHGGQNELQQHEVAEDGAASVHGATVRTKHTLGSYFRGLFKGKAGIEGAIEADAAMESTDQATIVQDLHSPGRLSPIDERERFYEEWQLHHVGNYYVEGIQCRLGELNVTVDLQEIKDGSSKGGLFVDSVIFTELAT